VLTPRRARLMLGKAYSRYFCRPSQLCNYVGRHKYAHHPLLKKADDWAWRKQESRDRGWTAERQATNTAAAEAANL
jgi:hypothetical protein